MTKQNKFFLIISLLIILSSVFLSACSNKNTSELTTPISSSGFFLGTVIDINIYNDVDEEIFDNVFSILENIENKMSINLEESEVIDINNNAGNSFVKVSDETFYVIQKGYYYSELSKGNFDISIGPLVKLWGIGSEDAKVPTDEEIDATLKNVNYKNVLIDEENSSIKLENENMILDLGAIAKGYAADVIATYLKDHDVDSAIINLGGNVYALGSKAGEDWSLGIQNPFDSRGSYFGILKVIDKTVVTSGIYERYFEENGVRYHHILSPYTGYPINNSLVSVSIITDNSIDADALSTTTFSLGLEEGLILIETLEDTEAIFVDEDYNVYTTSGLKDNFTITDNDFKLAN
ncbi:FAD:protein FMN transferase [Clostridium sp. DL1XJH146]